MAILTVNNEITTLVGEICFKLGKLEKTKDGSVDEEIVASNVISIFASKGINLSSSIVKGLKRSSQIESNPLVYRYFDLNKKLAKLNPFESDFFLEYQKAMGDSINLRSEKTIEGVDFLLPPVSRINAMMKSIFAYVKKSKDKMHPLLVSTSIYYSCLTVAPFSSDNDLFALAYAKAILVAYSKTFMSIRLEVAILKNKISFDESISNSISEMNFKYFAEEFLTLINYSLLSHQKGKIKSNKHYSNFVDKLLSVMEEDKYYSTNELLPLLELKSRITLMNNYLKPAIEEGKVSPLNPVSPRDRNQKYKKEIL